MYYNKFLQTLTNEKIKNYREFQEYSRFKRISFTTIEGVEIVNVHAENPNEICYNMMKELVENFSVPEDEKDKFSLREYLDEAQEKYVIDYLEKFKAKHDLSFSYYYDKTLLENIAIVFEEAHTKNFTDDEYEFFKTYIESNY